MSESYTAVGMVEFNSIAAGIDAADQMVKTAQVDPLFFKTICPGKFVAAVTGDVADVQLLDVRVALGLGGKGYALMTGDVAAVNAAVEAGSTAAAESGLLVSKVVIPSPAETVFEQIA